MYQAPRGTTDILPEDQPYWRYVESTFQQTARSFGYRRIDTPIFEDTGLFQRTVGEETDIVQKEMYSFVDRGEQSLTLRPEGTAAVCRAYLEKGMQNLPQPVRLSYVASMFRYDRPQAGRYRQFNQYGIEAIGDADAAVDLEVIQLALGVVEALGLGKTTMVLNNIGDVEDRPRYLAALQAYYELHTDKLCTACRHRYHANPLRLLDCKQQSCQPFLADAPRSTDYLGGGAKTHWEELLGYLNDLGIPHRLDHRLVRGLDYYTRTVFEIIPEKDGSQSAICAGGRYDGLIKQLGGKSTAGIGFAAGIERIILNLQAQRVEVPMEESGPLVVAFRGAQAKMEAVRLVRNLRTQGNAVVLAPERSLKAQMRYASSLDAPRVFILGDAEMAQGAVTVREMASGTQQQLPLADFTPGG
jgi:histidyl-tRNA synthetase